jgi:hypothetical protein
LFRIQKRFHEKCEVLARGLFYILGVRERSDKLVRDLVLDDPAPFVPLTITKRRKRSTMRPRR